MNYLRYVCIGLCGALVAGLLAQESALEIVRKVDEKAAVKTSIAKMSMRIYPYMQDKTNFRELKVLAYGKGTEDSYMEFVSPKSIQGLRILSRGGDQWVYFPSTGRVRKIAAKAKKESVQGVGGDFSYEDLSGGTLEEKYQVKIIKSDAHQWVLEGTPKSESSYNKIVLFVNKADYLVPKIEFYTPEDGHCKDLLQSEVKVISGKEMPTVMTMINLKKESKTVVIIHEASYDVPIDEKYFNPMRFYQ
jgi:outer membrane lipoprotein-sorting protein